MNYRFFSTKDEFHKQHIEGDIAFFGAGVVTFSSFIGV